MTRAVAVSALLTTLIALAGCGGSPATGKAVAESGDEVLEGLNLTYLNWTGPKPWVGTLPPLGQQQVAETATSRALNRLRSAVDGVTDEEADLAKDALCAAIDIGEGEDLETILLGFAAPTQVEIQEAFEEIMQDIAEADALAPAAAATVVNVGCAIPR